MQPVRKYQAIQLLKDLMETHNKALGKYVVTKILKRLIILAQHKNGTKEEGDEERGRDIFGKVKRDQEGFSISFLNTLLTAIEDWGKKWPKTPNGPYNDFHQEYNNLLMNKVKFPKTRPRESSISPAVSTSKSPVPRSTKNSFTPPSQEPSRIKKEAPVREKKTIALKPGFQRDFQ